MQLISDKKLAADWRNKFDYNFNFKIFVYKYTLPKVLKIVHTLYCFTGRSMERFELFHVMSLAQ